MLLKKQYDHSSGSPVLTHVKVLRAKKYQKFATELIQREIASGLFSVVNGRIIIKTIDGEPDLVYKIVSGPGTYCCFCNAQLADSKDALQHVQDIHPKEKCPDSQNPAGYRVDHFYFGEKED